MDNAMTPITNRGLSLLSLALCAWGPVLQAQEGKGAVVTFDGQPLFEIHSSVGSFSAEVRSRELSARMLQVAQDSGIPESAITISDSEDATDVVAGGTILTAVTAADARAARLPRQELARQYAQKIRAAITGYRVQHSSRNLVRGLVFTMLGSAALVLIFVAFRRLFARLQSAIQSWRQTRLRAVAIQQVELLSADRIAGFLRFALKIARLAVSVLVLYGYLLLVFSSFPGTKDYAADLMGSVR